MNLRQRRNKKRKNIIYIDNPLNGAFSLSHLDLEGMIQLQDLIKKSRELPIINNDDKEPNIKEVLSNRPKYLPLNFGNGTGLSLEELKKLKTVVNEYEKVLNNCFLEKPELIKFDSNNTDEDIDNFFDKL